MASVSSLAHHVRAAACALALVCAGVAAAETLGDARQLSRLGEPLRLAIPIRSDGSPPLNDRCLSVASSRESDGLPHILTANVAVERDAAGGTVLVTTTAPVREPVSRLVIRTACDGTSRQYTLFLEPAGSTRQVRAVAQPGPPVPGAQSAVNAGDAAARVPANATDSRRPGPSGSPAPVVTVIPVVPARPTSSKPSQLPPKDVIAPATAPSARPAAPSGQVDAASATESSPTTPASPAAAALAAENENLRQQLAQLNDELQRLQQPAVPTRDAPGSLAMATGVRAPATPPASGWEAAWPALVALAGLAALTAGGFMWRRRHNAADEWALTGPPSHRVVSRTSLAEEPVTFRQAGVRADAPTEEPHMATSVLVVPMVAETAQSAPASLRLQPSTEDLARDLEQELFIAEHAHSALERAHPDIVDALTRSWGTAAARQLMGALLQAGSAELARMSGEAVVELRLLLRIAEDANPRSDPEPYPPSTLSPPAPAW